SDWHGDVLQLHGQDLDSRTLRKSQYRERHHCKQAPVRHEIDPRAERSGEDSRSGIVQTTGAEDFVISRPKYAFRRWQHPRFVHHCGERDTAPSTPRVPRTRHHDEGRIVEKFETKFLVAKAGRSASN